MCTHLAAAYAHAGFPEAMQLRTETSFSHLKRELDYLARGQQLVFLIDDYDYPLSSHLDDPQLFAALQSVMSEFHKWLNQQTSARFILVTGIMRYREASLFWGPNLIDISMDPEYADLLSYTKEDIEQHFADYIPQAANNLGISTDELWQLLERYYAGFCFDEDASVKVYNPYSINKFFAPLDDPNFRKRANAKLTFAPYWLESYRPSAALRSFLRAHKYDVAKLVNKYSQPLIVNRGAFKCYVNVNEVTLDQIMVQSGQISIREIANPLISAALNTSPTRYKCEITNAEVASTLSAIFTYCMAHTEE